MPYTTRNCFTCGRNYTADSQYEAENALAAHEASEHGSGTLAGYVSHTLGQSSHKVTCPRCSEPYEAPTEEGAYALLKAHMTAKHPELGGDQGPGLLGGGGSDQGPGWGSGGSSGGSGSKRDPFKGTPVRTHRW